MRWQERLKIWITSPLLIILSIITPIVVEVLRWPIKLLVATISLFRRKEE